MSVTGMFFKYVSQNILGMIGISLYILADTFFISVAEGADGITALNLVLPVYSIIYAIGAMIGVGAATRFTIERTGGGDYCENYFSNSIICAFLLSIVFIIIGMFFPEELLGILGADASIQAVGRDYTRIFMIFAPFFMWNHIFNAFVRNDKNPSLAMAATLLSSLFNIVMDYVLMFPLGLGMAGAALATAVSPIVGISICSIHIFSRRSSVRLRLIRPSLSYLVSSCKLGISAFVGEISTGVTTALFNIILLGLGGNTAVAAYAVVANIALVAVSCFNGVSQGAQPLISSFYGRGDEKSLKKTLRLGIITALFLAALIIGAVIWQSDALIAVFNTEGNKGLSEYAREGIRLYFPGFLFGGVNIVLTGYFSATNQPATAGAASVSRGFVSIALSALLLSWLFGIKGVWLAFIASELITLIITVAMAYWKYRSGKKGKTRTEI